LNETIVPTKNEQLANMWYGEKNWIFFALNTILIYIWDQV